VRLVEQAVERDHDTTPAASKAPNATPGVSSDECPPGVTIPQGGGDQDADNSGGTSDGDGCV
jgi:hypothetical protein